MFLVKTMILFFILKCLSFIVNISFYRLVEFNTADMEAEDQVVAGDAVISDDEEVTLFVSNRIQFIARNAKIYRLMLLSCHWMGQTNVTKPWTDKQKLRFISTSSNVRPIMSINQINSDIHQTIYLCTELFGQRYWK